MTHGVYPDEPGQPEVLIVDWLDSGMQLHPGWAPVADYIKDVSTSRMSVTTVGMLMHEDEYVMVLGLSYDAAHQAWFGAQVIAKQNITRARTLSGATHRMKEVA